MSRAAKTIRFSVDKRGALLAHYWGGSLRPGPAGMFGGGGRWLRMGADAAKVEIAAGDAVRYVAPIASVPCAADAN